MQQAPARPELRRRRREQPGVQEDTGETQGRSLAISVYGSTSAENLYMIDGVNTTNVVKG